MSVINLSVVSPSINIDFNIIVPEPTVESYKLKLALCLFSVLPELISLRIKILDISRKIYLPVSICKNDTVPTPSCPFSILKLLEVLKLFIFLSINTILLSLLIPKNLFGIEYDFINIVLFNVKSESPMHKFNTFGKSDLINELYLIAFCICPKLPFLLL